MYSFTKDFFKHPIPAVYRIQPGAPCPQCKYNCRASARKGSPATATSREAPPSDNRRPRIAQKTYVSAYLLTRAPPLAPIWGKSGRMQAEEDSDRKASTLPYPALKLQLDARSPITAGDLKMDPSGRFPRAGAIFRFMEICVARSGASGSITSRGSEFR